MACRRPRPLDHNLSSDFSTTPETRCHAANHLGRILRRERQTFAGRSLRLTPCLGPASILPALLPADFFVRHSSVRSIRIRVMHSAHNTCKSGKPHRNNY
jgi:hypothetical protein